jgi:hypothetical protein
VHVQNWGLKRQQVLGTDGRLVYTAANKGSNNAYVMTNSNRVMYTASVKVQKNFINGLFASLAYNYLVSKMSILLRLKLLVMLLHPALGNVNNAVLSNSKYGDNTVFYRVAT